MKELATGFNNVMKFTSYTDNTIALYIYMDI